MQKQANHMQRDDKEQKLRLFLSVTLCSTSDPVKITFWLFGCSGRLRIMASISSNLLSVACTSACSSLYSAYWSLNTARYWSRSSSERIDGYLLRDGGRESVQR